MKYCNTGCCIINEKVTDCNRFTLDLYLEALPRFREAGLRHIELSHLMALSGDDALLLRKECHRLGLTIWSIHSENFNDAGGMSPGGAYSGGTLEEYFEKQLHCARIAQILTAQIYVCHLPHYTLQPRFDFQRNVEIITKLAEMTRKHDLILGVENCLTGDLDHIVSIVDHLNRSDVGINLDVGHCFFNQDKDIANWIRKLGKRLVTLHLHDNFGHCDDHQTPGMGLIDWGSVMKALKESPYEGPLMMELTSRTVKNKREDAFLREYPLDKELILGTEFLKKCFHQI